MPSGAFFIFRLFSFTFVSMIEIIGYVCALAIGLVLGLTGGGGSILTVPVLAYIIGLDAVTATAYSLFIVGTTSAVGTLQNIRKGLVEIKTGLLYALPSLAGVYLSRKIFIGSIPKIVYYGEDFVITKDTVLMLGFAVVILSVSLSMLRKKPSTNETIQTKNENPFLIGIRLFVAGILVGMVGAGGGFLFTPLLLYVAKLPMKKAVATSLLIIAINSLLGFTGDIGNIAIDWNFLLLFTSFSIAGIFLGIYLSRFVNEQQLKKGFGWFVLTIGIFILLKEIVF